MKILEVLKSIFSNKKILDDSTVSSEAANEKANTSSSFRCPEEEAAVEQNQEVINWLYTECLKSNTDFYMVSEVWEPLGLFAQYYESKTPSIFNFDAGQQTGMLFNAGKGYMTPTAYIDKLVSYDNLFSTYNENYIDALFLTNHDMGRVSEVCVNNEKTMKMSAGLKAMI